MAYGDAACVCQSIAWAYDEAIECVVWVDFDGGFLLALFLCLECGIGDAEFDGDEVACDVLSCLSEWCSAIIAEVMRGRLVRTCYIQKPSFERTYKEVVEPFSTVYGIECFYSIKYFHKNIR